MLWWLKLFVKSLATFHIIKFFHVNIVYLIDSNFHKASYFVGEKIAFFVGANFTPHVLTVNPGEVRSWEKKKRKIKKCLVDWSEL